MNRLCCPFGAWMIAESTLLCVVGGVICLKKGTIVVIPLRSNDGEHLTALQGHFDYVFVREAESTFSRIFTCYEDVHPKVESGSIAI
jgi:hypothetical protein